MHFAPTKHSDDRPAEKTRNEQIRRVQVEDQERHARHKLGGLNSTNSVGLCSAHLVVLLWLLFPCIPPGDSEHGLVVMAWLTRSQPGESETRSWVPLPRPRITSPLRRSHIKLPTSRAPSRITRELLLGNMFIRLCRHPFLLASCTSSSTDRL